MHLIVKNRKGGIKRSPGSIEKKFSFVCKASSVQPELCPFSGLLELTSSPNLSPKNLDFARQHYRKPVFMLMN